MIRALAIASDLMVGADSHVVEEHPDRVVIRTPEQPAYWYGNSVVFRSFTPDVEAAMAQFRADFPQARHVCIQWDLPGLEADLGAFVARGFETDVADTLVLQDLKRFPMPEGITCRPIASDADWAQVVDLQHEVGVSDEGQNADGHRSYIEGRFARHRAAVAEGRAMWFGAFDGALLVADMGVYADGRLARFQSVETRASHRGRGICAALVGVTSVWATARAQEVVIVADRGEAPGRIYRRCGYELRETVLAVVKPGY